MQAVVATFTSRDAAGRAAERLGADGVPRARIGVLMPGTPAREVERRVPIDEGESPGMGAAVGGVIGGAVGLSAAAVVLPGVGPLVLAGMLAAGVAGTAGGAAVGDTLEEILSNGVPRDDLPKYEDALRRGRSLVVALAERDDELSRARELLAAAGAETIDGAPAQ